MDVAAELTTARDALVNAIVAACANPKPNYSLDGQSVSWGEYLKMLRDGVKELNEMIVAFAPVELRTQVY